MAKTLREELVRDMEDDVAANYRYGRLNNISDLTFTIVAAAASLVGSIVVGTKLGPAWVAASLTAIPVACLTLQRLLDLRGRAAWYFEYSARVRALIYPLKYGDQPNVEEYARKRGEVDTEMERAWASLVTRSTPPIPATTPATSTASATTTVATKTAGDPKGDQPAPP